MELNQFVSVSKIKTARNKVNRGEKITTYDETSGEYRVRIYVEGFRGFKKNMIEVYKNGNLIYDCDFVIESHIKNKFDMTDLIRNEIASIIKYKG